MGADALRRSGLAERGADRDAARAARRAPRIESAAPAIESAAPHTASVR
jgi:hypothetical protein